MKRISCSLLNILWIGLAFFLSAQSCAARIADPYPIAILRLGDIHLIEGRDKIIRLTELGDIKEICWLDEQTICFSRVRTTGLINERSWLGFESVSDLFTVSRSPGRVKQFTANHFARGPSPSPMYGRALFWRDNRHFGTISEIWESIHPLRRDRPLGIQGIDPDCSPDQRWTAASLGDGSLEGVGLYRFPTNDSYRKLRGPHYRPRFSPDGQLYTYISEESGKTEIWGFDIPDGEPRRLLGPGEKIERIIDFGWAKDGSGYILVMEDLNQQTDVYYWEIETKKLLKLTETGDVKKATSWH
jgi:hypothetical protein